MNLTTKNSNVAVNSIKMKRKRRFICPLCLFLLGSALISLGLFIFIYTNDIYDAILNQAMTFKPGTEAYKAWKINDPPLDIDMYLFNWTNPGDINNPQIKPKFKEVGPYRFKEVREKINVSWDGSLVSYSHKKTYYFDAPNSVRNLSDTVTIVNAVPLTIGYKAKEMGYFAKKLISMGLSSVGTGISVTKNVSEILFDGFEENVLSVLSSFPMLDVKDKFGIFYGRNGTPGLDGISAMSTRNDENFGKIALWNGKNTTNFYEGHCNNIQGSAGEFYPLHQKRDKIIFYSAELCKYAELEYEYDVHIKGVHGYKYTGKFMLDNGEMRPESKCFCLGDCLPTGVLNVSACREGSPSFLSMPHFYNADPFYTQSIDGMEPLPDHEFFIVLEPNSGIIMEITAGMQLNFLMQPVSNIRLYESVPKVVIPVFYFYQKIKLSDELAGNLRLIQNMPEYLFYTSLIVMSLGIISIFWSICSLCCCKTRQQTKKKYKSPKQNTPIREEIPLYP